MNKGIVIATFVTCGKTYLTKKYKNVIDLESSNYKFDNSELINIPKEERNGTVRKINKDWPENYYKAIGSYDIVLVQLKLRKYSNHIMKMQLKEIMKNFIY